MVARKTPIERALLEQHILGLTTEEEGRQVAQYLIQNPAVAREIKEAQLIMEEFAIEYAKYFALINSVNFRKWIFSIDFL